MERTSLIGNRDFSQVEISALYQTMYLVATAMNLAAYVQGLGNADLFAFSSAH